MDTAKALTDYAAIIGGTAWGHDKGKPRIYCKSGRKDVKVYFEFPDFIPGEDLGGATLKIWIDDNGTQGGQWYANVRRDYMRGMVRRSLALTVLTHEGPAALAQAALECVAQLTKFADKNRKIGLTGHLLNAVTYARQAKDAVNA